MILQPEKTFRQLISFINMLSNHEGKIDEKSLKMLYCLQVLAEKE